MLEVLTVDVANLLLLYCCTIPHAQFVDEFFSKTMNLSISKSSL